MRTWRVADGAAGPVLVPPPARDPARSTPACASAEAQVAELMRPAASSALGVRDPSAWSGLQTVPEIVLSSDGENVLVPVAEESCVSLLKSGCSIGCSRHYHLERIAVRTGRRLQTLPVDQELLGGCVPPGGAFVTRGDRGGIQLRDPEGEPVARAGSKLGQGDGVRGDAGWQADAPRVLEAARVLGGRPADDAGRGAAPGADRWTGGVLTRGVTPAWMRTGRSSGCGRGPRARWRAASRSRCRTTSRPRRRSRRTGDCSRSGRRGG